MKGSIAYDDLLARIRKTGKEVCCWIPSLMTQIRADELAQVRSGEEVVE